MTSVTTSEQQYHQADGTRTRTPSPREDTYSSNIMSGSGSGGEVEVPSPIPASISSSSSEPSHSQHGSSGNMSNYGGGVGGAPVPNLFALNTSGGGGGHPAPPMPSSSTNGWGVHAYETGTGGQHPPPHPLSAGYHPYPPPHHHQQQQPPPPPFQGYHQLYPGPIPMVVSTPAPPPLPNSNGNCHSSPVTTTTTTTNTATSSSDWARNESCPNFSIGTTEKSPTTNSARTKASSGRRRSYTKSNSQGSDRSSSNATTTTTAAEKGGGTNRRQKRLERNRESARLSRRRRKHYLEILEERVTQLSTEVDQGRRAHAALAVPVVVHKRREVLLEAPDKTDEERVRLLQHGLGRTSAEMMLVNTFKYQQLKSFALPAHSKFVLWLTLQNDQYFRGGRAASERLSAARIGERVSTTRNVCLFVLYETFVLCLTFALPLSPIHQSIVAFCIVLFICRCYTVVTTESPPVNPCGLWCATKLDCPTIKRNA